MEIYDEILEILKNEYTNGKTYQEIGKKHGVSYSYIREIMLEKKHPKRLSLETMFKIFPNAQITLNSEGNMNGPAASSSESTEAFRDRALKVLMDLDIPADALVKVLKTIKDLK